MKKPTSDKTPLKASTRLREVRRARRMTLMQLGKLTDQNYQTVQRHEVGENEMTVEQLLHYAKALDIPPALLLPVRDDLRDLLSPKLQALVNLLRFAPAPIIDGMHRMALEIVPAPDPSASRKKHR